MKKILNNFVIFYLFIIAIPTASVSSLEISPEILENAIASGNIEKIKSIILKGYGVNKKDAKGRTLLENAIWDNQYEIAKFLIKNGSNVNIKTSAGAPISIAILNNNIKLVTFLIDNNADLNIPDCFGYKPIHRAVEMNNSKMIRVLVNAGVDVNSQQEENGKYAIHVAAEKLSLDALKTLVKLGAEINRKSKSGNTALHEVLFPTTSFLYIPEWDLKKSEQLLVQYQIRTLQFLIKSGSSCKIKNNDGLTPLEYYKENKMAEDSLGFFKQYNVDIIRILQQH